jgi:hypothetical protein
VTREEVREFTRLLLIALIDDSFPADAFGPRPPPVDLAEAEWIASRAIELSHEDADWFDQAMAASAMILRNVRHGSRVELIADFMADVAEGRRQRPRRKKPHNPAYAARDALLSSVTAIVAQECGIGAYGKAGGTLYAANVVAEVYGCSVNIVEKACQRGFPR